MMPSLSRRLSEIQPSASVQVNETVIALRQQGKLILNFAIGEPDIETPDPIKKAAVVSINENFSTYTSSRGILELREAVCRKLRTENIISCDTKNIIITPGVKQALYYLNCCLIDPGDEAIIFEPYWVTYIDSLKLCGGIPVPVCGYEANGFKPTIQEIRQKITPRTKYILFSNPANPTGAVWDEQELQELVKLAREHTLFLIVDEIYEKILFDERKFVSAAAGESMEDFIITLNGFSKGPAMVGYRLGFVVAHESIINALVKIQQQLITCPSSISQKAAIVAFDIPGHTSAMVHIYQHRRDILVNGLNTINYFSCSKPAGTFYLFVRISGLRGTSLEMVQYLLEKAHLSTVPGSAYGKNFDDYIRFSFATGEETIRLGLVRLQSLFGSKPSE